MQVYSYSEARQNLSTVLKQGEKKGQVIIKRKDGSTFALTPQTITTSPLDVSSIKVKITKEEIVELVRKGRERPGVK